MKKTLLNLILFLFLVAPSQAQEIKIYLPLIFKGDMTTDNNWRIIQPVASSNKVLNPSAETTGNFTHVNTGVVTRVTTDQKYGLYSYRVQTTIVGDGIQLNTGTLTNEEHFVTVRVKKPYPTLQAVLNANNKTLVFIEKIDEEWDLLGIDFPAALANAATTLRIVALAAGDFNLDGVQVEPLPYWTTYIDGTQQGCAWLGSAHAAASERSGQSRSGGRSFDFFEEYGFRIHRIIGAGASSPSVNIDSYAVLPGGELNSVKIESRDFQIIGEFIADTEMELHENRQALEAAFQTDDNQLTLIRFNGAKVQKEIGVRYQGGLESDLAAFYGDIEISENESTKRILFSERASVQVVAPRPFWFEVGESAVELDTNDSEITRIVAGRLRSTGQWNVLGPPNIAGSYTDIRAIAEDAIYVYFGGAFTNFDNIANADRIVRWHKQDQTWSALGTGANNTVEALAVGPDGILYAGGNFTSMGGVANTNYIASWNGTAWSALSTGMDDIVSEIVIGIDGTLYAAGDFLNAGGGGAVRIASWNGSAWSALGAGVDDFVDGLAVGIDGTIFVGGDFLNAGGSGANRIASWNPDTSTWSTLGTGMNNVVNALVVMPNGNLIATGNFTTAGGNTATRIASWNGTAWSALGDGLEDSGFSLAVGPDGVLYVGGDFVEAGGIDVAQGLAKWNNYTWAHLDIRLPGTPRSLAVFASGFSDPVVEQNYDIYINHQVNGSTVNFAGAVTASNDGSVQAFPKIIYARSGGTTATIETLRNETTGKELLFNYPLLNGETLTIDLDPLAKSIESSFFGSRLDAILANSDFGIWSLPRGDSNITSYINESGTPTLVKYMQWRDAYSGYD